MEEVRQALAHSGLSERVELPGWVSPQEVNQWLAKSDILLMPSLLDSMPIAGLQGLAMGLALVLSNIGSCPDYIDGDRNGFLVTPGDVEGYAAALRRLLSDKNLLKNARAASRAHAQRFDLTKAIDDYENILAEAAA
jgi:glycosyltransferase involved in cell wall biosynthesis